LEAVISASVTSHQRMRAGHVPLRREKERSRQNREPDCVPHSRRFFWEM
jgi:hypothetical protein